MVEIAQCPIKQYREARITLRLFIEGSDPYLEAWELIHAIERSGLITMDQIRIARRLENRYCDEIFDDE